MNRLVEQLVATMPPIADYPSGLVEPIAPRVRGRAFFPGGCGLFNGAEQMIPACPVMLVGQDFGTKEYWSDLGTDDEPEDGTWSGLKTILADAGIDPRRCFFTNALLGVRVAASMEGPSPGLVSQAYVDACMVFLRLQIRTVRPSVIVALGVVPTMLLARELGILPSLSRPAPGRVLTWNALDAMVEPFVPRIACDDAPPFAFASSVHPARHWLNTKRRFWRSRSLSGVAAHNAVWSEVWGTASHEPFDAIESSR